LILFAALCIPMALVLVWQYAFWFGDANSLRSGAHQVVLAPLVTYAYYSSSLGTKFILSIAFPLSLSVLYYRELRHARAAWLAWCTFLVGVIYTYFLAEQLNGQVLFDGNFWWGSQIALFILFVYCASVWLRLAIHGPRTSKVTSTTIRFAICSAILVAHVVCGVFAYWMYTVGYGWRSA